jgi:antibiotic biosynthesis monooxygenase (ABM) superfamily enzyme
MAFDELKEQSENIHKQAQEYLKSNIAYYKLWGFKVAMKSTAMVFKFALILLCLSMVLFFCSLAAALAIGKYLDNYPLGFLIVAGFYLLVTVILFLIKNKIIEGTILEKFSEIFFND